MSKHIIIVLITSFVTFSMGMLLYWIGGGEFERGVAFAASFGGSLWLAAMMGALAGIISLSRES